MNNMRQTGRLYALFIVLQKFLIFDCFQLKPSKPPPKFTMIKINRTQLQSVQYVRGIALNWYFDRLHNWVKPPCYSEISRRRHVYIHRSLFRGWMIDGAETRDTTLHWAVMDSGWCSTFVDAVSAMFNQNPWHYDALVRLITKELEIASLFEQIDVSITENTFVSTYFFHLHINFFWCNVLNYCYNMLYLGIVKENLKLMISNV